MRDHVLCIQGMPVATYQLIGVILYKLDGHYIYYYMTDVCMRGRGAKPSEDKTISESDAGCASMAAHKC